MQATTQLRTEELTDNYHIPEELRETEQWITFRLEEDDDGKEHKKPCDTSITDGKYGPFVKYSGVRSPENFVTFDEAIDFVSQTNRRDDVKGLDGVGFVFTEDDDYVGVDLDDCVDEDVDEWAERVVDEVASYAELSPSGDGIHIIARGSLDDSYQNRNDSLGIEMYSEGRFFTVTGDHLAGTPQTVESVPAALRGVQRRLVQSGPAPSEEITNVEGGPQSARDEQVIRTAKSFDDEFRQLYEGLDIKDTNDGSSRSDLSFCNKLAFYTKNMKQIERIWKNSPRSRPKLRRDDYVQNTIEKAIAFQDDTYNGDYR